MNIKTISKDFALNILSAVMLTGTLQLFVYPWLAIKNTIADYGEILTIMGLANTLMAASGNGLNNLRLIQHSKYEKYRLIGDYNILLSFVLIFNTIVIFFLINYTNLNPVNKLSFLILVLLGIIRIYYSVTFRLNINYKKNFVLNTLLAMGYLIVINTNNFVINLQPNWLILFILPEIIAIIYIIRNSDLYKEQFVKTILFRDTGQKLMGLFYLTLIGNIMIYMDRNVLYPILGGTVVAVFFAATVIGKAGGIVMQPIAGVLLTYFAQPGYHMSLKRYWLINLIVSFFCVLAYLVICFAGDDILRYLYPTLYDLARPYLYIANIIPLLGIIAALAQPAVLKLVSIQKQCIFQTIYFFVYILVCFLGAKFYGLIGFCYANIFIGLIRVMVLWLLGAKALKG